MWCRSCLTNCRAFKSSQGGAPTEPKAREQRGLKVLAPWAASWVSLAGSTSRSLGLVGRALGCHVRGGMRLSAQLSAPGPCLFLVLLGGGPPRIRRVEGSDRVAPKKHRVELSHKLGTAELCCAKAQGQPGFAPGSAAATCSLRQHALLRDSERALTCCC